MVTNGLDNYAVIKLAQDTTKEEIKAFINTLEATTLDIDKLKRLIEDFPKIRCGIGEPPSDLKDDEIYFKYE